MRVVKDRRSSLRVAIEGEVFVYTERDRLEAQCLDLGMDGMLVRSAWPTYSRRLLTVEAFVGGERLRLDAELVRHREIDEGHELALRFVDVTPATAAALERIIVARLRASTRRGHAQAFEAGALRGSAAGSVGPEPEPEPEHEPDTERAFARPGPVISGLTEVMERGEPVGGFTMIAPPPRAEPPVVADARGSAVHFDASWDEEEADTARFRRITDDVGPGHTERLDREGRPLPPERTVIVAADDLAPPPEPERTRLERTMIVAADDVVPPPRSEQGERTMIIAADDLAPPPRPEPATPPDRVTPPGQDHRSRLVTAAAAAEASPSARASREPSRSISGTLSSPHEPHIEPEPEPEPEAPPLLRGGGTTPSVEPEPGPAGTTRQPSSRPSQRALQQARAMLATGSPPGMPRRRPRVIVSIPHRTYPARGRIRGLR